MIGLRRKALMALVIWGALSVPAMAQTTLRMVSHADIKILDPIWTTALITRNFGYMVYDTLFSTDADLKVQPQMAEKYTVSDDKMTWTFTLRDGLLWSDGTPVTSDDCIASIERWGARDTFGQALLQSTGELKKIDDKTFAIVLKQPFGLVLESLGKISSNVPFMMPKRVAETDPYKQIIDYTGSGPFIFKADEWKPGEKAVFVGSCNSGSATSQVLFVYGMQDGKLTREEFVNKPNEFILSHDKNGDCRVTQDELKDTGADQKAPGAKGRHPLGEH